MAKSRLRAKRNKYYQKANKDWLFDRKSKLPLIIAGIILSLFALMAVIGAIKQFFR